MSNKTIVPISPSAISISDVNALERNIFYDQRGFLIETFAQAKEKTSSVYSYNSLTHPGFARDIDRFHFHSKQKDRFTIVLGKMWILLYDARQGCSSQGKLEVVEASGGDPEIKEKKTFPVFTITIPEGVYHGIMNPGPSWAMLVNHPTSEYNPEDEGRILFSRVPIPSLGGKNFSWEKVKK
ncbi:MAG TPA: dTDP-4-dehydrorhamnose 3,5-epimerase family protein [Clostridia bacterium]|nr:dTDP-4-dehydrorhamnose 3,5-epimerase family protein [Clostridia bacterium]